MSEPDFGPGNRVRIQVYSKSEFEVINFLTPESESESHKNKYSTSLIYDQCHLWTYCLETGITSCSTYKYGPPGKDLTRGECTSGQIYCLFVIWSWCHASSVLCLVELEVFALWSDWTCWLQLNERLITTFRSQVHGWEVTVWFETIRLLRYFAAEKPRLTQYMHT